MSGCPALQTSNFEVISQQMDAECEGGAMGGWGIHGLVQATHMTPFRGRRTGRHSTLLGGHLSVTAVYDGRVETRSLGDSQLSLKQRHLHLNW